MAIGPDTDTTFDKLRLVGIRQTIPFLTCEVMVCLVIVSLHSEAYIKQATGPLDIFAELRCPAVLCDVLQADSVERCRLFSLVLA